MGPFSVTCVGHKFIYVARCYTTFILYADKFITSPLIDVDKLSCKPKRVAVDAPWYVACLMFDDCEIGHVGCVCFLPIINCLIDTDSASSQP